MYINRHIEKAFNNLKKLYKVVLITGSRQIGKTTFLKNVCKKIDYISLDNLNTLMSIKNDPMGFFENNDKELILDEIQRAKESFLAMKYFVDNVECKYYLTGSEKFSLMNNVSESLAGRIAILEMYGLSNREIFNYNINAKEFLPTKEYFKSINKNNKIDNNTLWKRILKGSYPELYDKKITDLKTFYSNLVETYIDRDVREIINIKNAYSFKQFIVMLAARSGQILNMSEIGNEINVDSKTIKSWISILEASNIIKLIYPFSLNVNKRIIKAPKVYFMDTGLLCYLAKWYDYETLKSGASSGSIFETFVISEIIKSYANIGKSADLYYFRTTNSNEIDLLFYENNTLYPIEIKQKATITASDISTFKLLKEYYPKVSIGSGGVICTASDFGIIAKDNYIIPITYV